MSEQVNKAQQAMSAVMNDVRALAKSDRNEQQGFRFRGIDAVMNAVGPALRDHKLVVQPRVLQITMDSYQTSKGTVMSRAVVGVEYIFTAEDGSHISAQAYGEAADAGDKAVSKAMSVAYRTALLQSLCLPTHETDPDAETHERVVDAPRYEPTERDVLFDQLRSLVRVKGLGEDNVPAAFERQMGTPIGGATVEQVREYITFVDSTGTLETVEDG